MKIHTLLAGAMMVAFLGAPAAATDFTFDVPVDVRNVPLIRQVKVECFVSALSAGTPGASSSSNMIGRGSTTVDAPSGNYSGTVSVPVENQSLRRSVDARSYNCSIFGIGSSPSGTPIELNSWSLELQRMTGVGLVSQTLWTEGNLP